jgi:hypothetical protein
MFSASRCESRGAQVRRFVMSVWAGVFESTAIACQFYKGHKDNIINVAATNEVTSRHALTGRLRTTIVQFVRLDTGARGLMSHGCVAEEWPWVR